MRPAHVRVWNDGQREGGQEADEIPDECVAIQLKRKCSRTHDHADLKNGVSCQTITHPDALQAALTKGMQDQVSFDEKGQCYIGSIERKVEKKEVEVAKASTEELHEDDWGKWHDELVALDEHTSKRIGEQNIPIPNEIGV